MDPTGLNDRALVERYNALRADLDRTRQQVIQLLAGRFPPEGSAFAAGRDLRERLASVAARLAAIERRLGEAGAGPG